MLIVLEQKALLAKYDSLGACLYKLHRFTLNPRPENGKPVA
jgi:hypothetical protein